MWPMKVMCTPVDLTGVFLVRELRMPPSHAVRMMGESVFASRSMTFNVLANSPLGEGRGACPPLRHR